MPCTNHSEEVFLGLLGTRELSRSGDIGKGEGDVGLGEAQNVAAVQGLDHLGCQACILVLEDKKRGGGGRLGGNRGTQRKDSSKPW